MFFHFYSPACFLYSSFPSLFLISSCVTLDLLYLPMHWPWILSSCLLWMMLLWAYAWLFSHALSELKLRSDFACSKGWGFSFLWGFHSHPPTEMVFLNDNDTPPPHHVEVCLVFFSLRIQSCQGVKGGAGHANNSLPALVLSRPPQLLSCPRCCFLFWVLVPLPNSNFKFLFHF